MEPSQDSTTTTLVPLRSLAYREVASVPFPIHLTPLPGTDLLVIASKDGRLWLYGDDGLHAEPFLDIRDRVRDRGEQGLLGLAFSPDHPRSGRLFVHYTATDGDTVLSEYVAEAGAVDPDSEIVLFRVAQPAAQSQRRIDRLRPGRLSLHGPGRRGSGERPLRARPERPDPARRPAPF